MLRVIHPDFIAQKADIERCIENFGRDGEMLGEAVRNTIKIFEINGRKVNIKAFKTPNLLNRFIYGYIRKSKAQRSYEYANKLISFNIGTPQPIAYFQDSGVSGLRESYYVSEQLQADLLFRELTTNPNYPDRTEILKQYTRFIFGLHEKQIEFIDNTSGNTLIKKHAEGIYNFYLVDLNRMNFGSPLSFDKRMENIAKLTTVADIVAIISEEYAKLSNRDKNEVHKVLSAKADRFQQQFVKRRKLKRKLKFWSAK